MTAPETAEARPAVGIVLMYHRILDANTDLDPHRLRVSPSNFADQLNQLGRLCRVMPLDEFVDELERAPSPAGRPAAVVTSDDGYVDNYDNAYPTLRELGMPAIVFLPTDYVDGRAGLFWWERWLEMLNLTREKRLAWDEVGRGTQFDLTSRSGREEAFWTINRWLGSVATGQRERKLAELAQQLGYADATKPIALSWDQVREMAGSGVAFGSHSRSHPAFSALSDAEAYGEAAESRLELERQLGQPIRHFAYPYGGRSEFRPEQGQILARAGYRSACTTWPGPVQAGTHAFLLNRVMAKNWSGDELKHHLESLLGH